MKQALMSPSRRRFLRDVTGASVAVLGGGTRSSHAAEDSGPEPARSAPAQAGKKFIAIQVGAVSFADEGVEKVLDVLQERGRVNALMLAVFTYGRGIAGRQIPRQPLPDHGAQEYDTSTFHGGSYTAVHSQFFQNSIFQDFRAPDVGAFDLLAEVVPKAKARGMASYCWFEDVYNPQYLAGFEQVAEVDVHGRRTNEACLNHPALRNFLRSLVEDFVKSHEVDGIMWGSERQGPLNNALGARHGGFSGQESLTCFCENCRKKGRERGIAVERAREGLIELEQLARATRSGPGPADGAFVSFWRLLLNYPEILAWEKLWTDSQHEIYGEIFGTVKAINPRVRVGWHIWHNNSFSPFYRAEQDYWKLRQASDFLKVVMYNNCGGPRLAQYVKNVQCTLFHDATPSEVLELHYRVLGYSGETSIEKLPATGLSADYVARETARAVAGVRGEIPIYPGIDIDIPTGSGEKKTQPGDVKAAVKAALGAGAQGVVLSRKYSEMRLANLAAAGEAVQEMGV